MDDRPTVNVSVDEVCLVCSEPESDYLEIASLAFTFISLSFTDVRR